MGRGIITLTTDFGNADHFVGAMKGVILKLNPDVELVDISHEVRAHDILDGAFTLAQAYHYFPPRTIHLVVVDPGVGTERRPLLASTEQWFIAPDNGVLSLICAREPDIHVRHITAEHFFMSPVSQTFQGRDIFAPVAGWLSRGVESAKFGDEITDYVRFSPPKPKVLNEKLVKGVVLKVDRFGNVITNLTPDDLPQLFQQNPPPFKFVAGKTEITKINRAYAQSPPGEVFVMVGSSGYLEFSTNRGAAARVLGVDRGAEVGVILG